MLRRQFCEVSTVMVIASIAVAQAPMPPVTSQSLLDALAKAPSAGSMMALPSSYPASFAAWSDTEKRSGLQFVAQRCATAYAMAGDNPNLRLLPAPMTSRDAATLTVSVCLPAKMPADWPDRGKFLAQAQRLIAEANTHGASLHLPTSLTQP